MRCHPGRKSPRGGTMNILKPLFSAQIKLFIIEPNKPFNKRLWLFTSKCIISVRGGHCVYSPRAALLIGGQCREIGTNKRPVQVVFVCLNTFFRLKDYITSVRSLCRIEA